MKNFSLLSLVLATSLMAGGYNIPEQSMNATALSAAYVANAHGADAAYYNPANMVFETGNGAFEVDLTYIRLSAVEAEGTYAGALSYDIQSEKEDFLIPTFHYVSPAFSDFRFGMSLVAPVGLSKRWNSAPATWKGEEFTLKTYEFNPTVAYKINDDLAIAVGVRGVYSEGDVVINASSVPNIFKNPKYDLESDGFDWGYNLALTYKATQELTLAATYRSKIDLELEGDATLTYPTGFGGTTVSDSGQTSIPLPAILRLATAYTFEKTTTIEFVYERNYWSKYEQLDIKFSGNSILNIHSPKKWDDTNTYRLGLTHVYNQKWTLMAGLGYDESPIPDETLSYELPDADARLYSLGARYKIQNNMEIGLSALYSDKEKRDVNQIGGINGSFDNSDAYVVTIGLEYEF